MRGHYQLVRCCCCCCSFPIALVHSLPVQNPLHWGGVGGRASEDARLHFSTFLSVSASCAEPLAIGGEEKMLALLVSSGCRCPHRLPQCMSPASFPPSLLCLPRCVIFSCHHCYRCSARVCCPTSLYFSFTHFTSGFFP